VIPLELRFSPCEENKGLCAIGAALLSDGFQRVDVKLEKAAMARVPKDPVEQLLILPNLPEQPLLGEAAKDGMPIAGVELAITELDGFQKALAVPLDEMHLRVDLAQRFGEIQVGLVPAHRHKRFLEFRCPIIPVTMFHGPPVAVLSRSCPLTPFFPIGLQRLEERLDLLPNGDDVRRIRFLSLDLAIVSVYIENLLNTALQHLGEVGRVKSF